MKFALHGLVVAGLAMFGSAGAAQAAPVVADFSGAFGLFDQLEIDLGGGLAVSVSADTHNGGASGDAPFPPGPSQLVYLHRNDEGVGARNLSSGFIDDLDAFFASEFLQFTFNQPVTLLSVVLENGQGNDEFDMAVDDVDVDVDALLGTDDLVALPDGGFGDDSGLADFAGDGLTGTVFQFYTTDASDAYRIRQFLVEAVSDEGGADVPAPPALMLLGMGLAGLGIARRRRR